jgi:septum formation protein
VPRIVLASQSPGRLQVLSNAGVTPHVHVSDVDEEAIEALMPDASPAELCLALAKAKAEAVAGDYAADPDVVVVGCDSVFDVDGQAFSKPDSPEQAWERWGLMMGRSGTLRTGHWLIRPATGESVGAVASTIVRMGDPTRLELAAYLATGEPLRVAGGFTLDALGGAFVEGIDGDPSNVVGLSLPTLRRLLLDLGVTWTDLWSSP